MWLGVITPPALVTFLIPHINALLGVRLEASPLVFLNVNEGAATKRPEHTEIGFLPIPRLEGGFVG